MKNASKIFLVFLVFLQLLTLNTNAQSWQWVVQDSGLCDTSGYFPYITCTCGSVGALATDRYGYEYIGGASDGIGIGSYFVGIGYSPTDPDPSASYIAKFDSLGNVIWVNGLYPVDISAGYGSTMDFSSIVVDRSGNVFSLTGDESTGLSDLNKYNPSGGLVWSRNPPFEVGYFPLTIVDFLAIDNVDNIYLAGSSSHGVGSLVVGSLTIPWTFPYNNFIAKYDTAGNAIWARVFGDATSIYSGNTQVTAMASDIYGNTIVAGTSTADSVCFGSVTLHQTRDSGTKYFFYAKYDSSGNLLFAKNAYGDLTSVGVSYASYHTVTGVTTDAGGNFYMVGDAGDSVTFGTTKTYNVQSFLGKFNSSGELVWLMHNPDSSYGSITSDAAGNIYVSDLFYNYYLSGTDSVRFRGAPSYFGSALSLLKFDTSGNLIWARQGPNAQVNALSCSNIGSLYVAGNYDYATIRFGDTTLLNGTPGNSRVFLAKLDTEYTDAAHNVANLRSNSIIYPNPTTGMLTLIPDRQGYTQICIYDVLGRVVFTLPLTGTETRVNVNMSDIPDGSYYLKATGATGMETVPFVVRR